MRPTPNARVAPLSEPAPVRERARGARASMDALTGSGDVFETFFQEAKIGLALADLSGSYIRANPTYARLLGRDPEDLVGVFVGDVLGGGDPGALPRLLAGHIASVQSERQYVDTVGNSTWVLHTVATVLSPEGEPAWFAVSAQDITERRRVEQELRELAAALTERAVRDPLTGLANRALLEERLRGSLARDARSGQCTAVLFLDLDGFKEVNDQHGHAVGDAVLRAVGERLTTAIRPSDTVARLGGDEFVILVEGADPKVLDALADRLEAVVSAPLQVDGLDLSVGVSVGMALSRGGAEDPQSLLDQADTRMYRAKRSQR